MGTYYGSQLPATPIWSQAVKPSSILAHLGIRLTLQIWVLELKSGFLLALETFARSLLRVLRDSFKCRFSQACQKQ